MSNECSLLNTRPAVIVAAGLGFIPKVLPGEPIVVRHRFHATMGWSLPKERRVKLLQESNALLDPKRTDLDGVEWIVVDLNTQIRMVTAGHEVSALLAAHRFIKRVNADAPNATVVVVADDSTKLPPIRAAVQQKRLRLLKASDRIKQERRGKIIVENRAFSRGSEPYTDDELRNIESSGIRAQFNWTRALANGRGKAIAYNLMVAALKHSAQSVIRGARFRFLLWHTGLAPYTFPADWDSRLVAAITDNAYGEADERVTEVIRAIQMYEGPGRSRVLVKTIDTDMLLQILVVPIDLRALLIQFKNELVDGMAWRNFFGARCCNDGGEAASSALMLNLASGCDYNSGLTPYGYRNAAIIEAAKNAPSFCTIDRTADAVRFDLVALARALNGIKRSNPLKDAKLFGDEIENATYTIAYFSGIKRKRGGPDRQRATALRARAEEAGESEFSAFTALALESESLDCTLTY